MSKHILVAAIDFGTTYSSWAFSFKHDYVCDPTKVCAKQWQGHESQKGPTCVLIKSDGKTVDSFGFDAETKYAELIEGKKHKTWYFFRRFKMTLWEQKLTRNSSLDDVNGRKLLARTVFALSIKYLKDDLWAVANDRIADTVLMEDIHWVLTVPAIWNNAAKQFMREAAEEAGLTSDMLTIALEPEAASLYCRHLPITKSGNQLSLASLQAGKQYLVLDAGGGTIDITVHEVTASGGVKELYKASGGAWGGTKVDDSFEEFLVRLTDETVVKKFKEDKLDDYIELLRRFEIKKRNIDPDNDSSVTICIPLSFSETVKKRTRKDFPKVLKKSSYSKSVTLSGDKLKIDATVARSFFEESVNSTIEHVKNVLQKTENRNVEAILSVGGFSESKMLIKAVKKTFPGIKIIVPDEAGLVVLKGAVMFGHEPTQIVERISKFTYGLRMNPAFDPTKHPASAKFTDNDGIIKCRDFFDTHVIAGQALKVGEAQSEETYVTKSSHTTDVLVEVFATKSQTPVLVTDPGCRQVGKYNLALAGTGGGRLVIVRMIFGGTEIDVEITEKTTSKVSHISIDFLS
ncbi:heat shock 70 kDa protein 12A-like [Mya arenaria]|uniref:heat shock 70 kDa protein 12A-like n=1 Tax=Mya arenaria TaxID=6604 RepID=UPI0022E82156|nr:heat shock 70 kDa protein 12A-like [Mya arenaria]XP_052779007.1 heat shock 70 kDa protein 12A-like [Mya arenaria]XP_052779008.1 heat shock 70 kDa protein 12A-like [Mya arenaria]